MSKGRSASNWRPGERHTTDTELGFLRGYEAGYAMGWSDFKHGNEFNDDPNKSDAFVYRTGTHKPTTGASDDHD